MSNNNKYNRHGYRISKSYHTFTADMSGEKEVKCKTTGRLIEVKGFEGFLFVAVDKKDMPEGAAGHCVFEFTTGLGITNPCRSRKFIEDETMEATRVLNLYGWGKVTGFISAAKKINEVPEVIEWQQ